MDTLCVNFDNGPIPGGTSFQSPSRLILAETPQQVPAALAALQDAQASGKWLAGFASYELGYVFSSKLRDLLPDQRQTPLLAFGVFDKPLPDNGFSEDTPATLSQPTPLWSLEEYTDRFDKIHAYIGAGDIYQANLTFPLSARRTGSTKALNTKLKHRQPAPQGAYVALTDTVLLSRSPELFFSFDATGNLCARPMKGTAARGATPKDDADAQNWLRTSEKNRAENLMIVDLLRNDLSRIAEIGSVKTPNLFDIETYATLHQMTSTITAQLRSNVEIAEIFESLFPCGSITGAPKIRAMQIIQELESSTRDAYCGAIGWIAPTGAMSFSVAIRTLLCPPDGSVRLNVGGGVVYDSDAQSEYNEALLKAKFADLSNS